MSAADIMTSWKAKVLGDPHAIRGIGARIKVNVTGSEGGTWIFNCKDPVGVSEGEGEFDCGVSLSAEDLVAISSGALNPQVAFMQGRLKVEGDMLLALKIQKLMDAV